VQDLIKFAHEGALMAGGAAAAFVTAVLYKLKGDIADTAAAGIEKVGHRLARIFSRSSGKAASPADEEAREALRNLAGRIRDRLRDEQLNLKLTASESPLRVGWRELSNLGEPVSRPGPASVPTDIRAAYAKAPSGRLVILGAGGSGKSVLLQRLALGMLEDLDELGEDHFPASGEVVPVIFSLGAWSAGMKLDDWLTGQLLRLRYDPGLDEEMARFLVEKRRVLPLLDGFDEVGADARAKLLDKLNDDVRRKLVLTSRPEEYAGALRGRDGKNGTYLSGAAVIQLAALPPEEAAGYLKRFHRTRERPENGSPRPAWEVVANKLLLKRKPPAAKRLAEVFGNPLMVAIARDVYQLNDPGELLDDGRFASSGEIENHLLDSFLPAIYDKETENPSRWREETACRAFRYMLSSPEPLGGARGQDIAWWEIGTAGMTPLRRSVLSGLAGGLVFAVMNGIAAFAAVLGVAGYKVRPTYGLELVFGHVIAVTLAFGLAHWLTIRYKSRLLEPSRVSIDFLGWLRAGRDRQHRHPMELACQFRDGLTFGSVAAFVGISGITLSDTLLSGRWFGESVGAPVHIVVALISVLAFILGITLVLGIALGLVTLFEVGMEIRADAGPLALLAANRRTAIRGGLALGVISGTALGIIDGIFQGAVMGLAFAVVGGVTIGAGGILSETAWGQWVVFCRVWLPLTGKLPWRARAFLDDAHQRGVLRQTGGIYQFRHSRLQARILQAREGSPAASAWLVAHAGKPTTLRKDKHKGRRHRYWS
jgi:hypothetical protein